MTKKVKPHALIYIDDGQLVCDYRDVKSPLHFKEKADEDAARSLGIALARRSLSSGWMYTSSIDFPEENDAPNLDFRQIIELAYVEQMRKV